MRPSSLVTRHSSLVVCSSKFNSIPIEIKFKRNGENFSVFFFPSFFFFFLVGGGGKEQKLEGERRLHVNIKDGGGG